MQHWTWASASRIGTSHERTGQRLQDAFSCFTSGNSLNPFFVAIVSDGAGSAEFGGQGASLVCRKIGMAARRHFASTPNLPSQGELEEWLDGARDSIYRAARNRNKEPRDFAATLVCAMSTGQSSIFAHVGDGCAVVRKRATGQWLAPTWPEHGQYASMTSFVTDQPVANLRVSQFPDEIDCIALFSDGLERMVLDMATRTPYERFFGVVSQPVLQSRTSSGRDAVLSAQLKAYLGSEQVNARTDDDKTLVLAALR